MAYEPSLKVIHAFLNPQTRKVLSLPLAALIVGAVSQVETTIELANRVCDSVFRRSLGPTTQLGGFQRRHY
jgi:hypothetical protein